MVLFMDCISFRSFRLRRTRGFAPTTYDIVDPQFGDWDDMKKLSEKYYLMYDYMINHISAHSEIYHDFLEKKDASEYRDFFIRFKDFWKNGEPTEEQISKIYLRKEQPYIEAEFADGTKEKLWCTFSPEQIDINCLVQKRQKNIWKKNSNSSVTMVLL